MIKPLRYNDILDLADALANAKTFDMDFGFEINSVIDHTAMLSEDDKCILGLALIFYSKTIDCPEDNCRMHEFCPHNAYASACYMEELAHSTIGNYIDVLKEYPSPSMFVNTITDAAFVVMNSMSRGFNVGFIKRFGGDAHLRWLASVFDILVCWAYVKKFYGPCGFNEYENFHLEKITDKGMHYTKRDSRLMYSRFATWLRRKLLVAQRFASAGMFPDTVVPSLISTLRSASEEQAKMADMVDRVSKPAIGKRTCGKCDHDSSRSVSDKIREDRSTTTIESTSAKKLAKKLAKFRGHDDSCWHWISCQRRGRQFEFNFDEDDNKFAVSGNPTDSDIAALKRSGLLPDGYRLSEDRKYFIPSKSVRIKIN